MSTFKGIIGGIIGGLIASLPWVILSVYFDMISSIAAIPIALGVSYGYRFFGGKDEKILPFVIAISSMLIICFVTMVIVPLWVYTKEHGFFDLAFLSWLYENPSARISMLKNLAVAEVFAIIGIVGVLKLNSMQEDDEVTKAHLMAYDRPDLVGKEGIMRAEIKEFFASKNAMDKNHLLYRSDLEEINADKELKSAFRRIKRQQIIKKKAGGYYYSEKAEANDFARFLIVFAKIMLIAIPIMFIIIYIAVNL